MEANSQRLERLTPTKKTPLDRFALHARINQILECRGYKGISAMKINNSYLGEFEELVLLAILRLDDNAYGTTIRQTVEEIGERFTSIGALYATLDRLEQKGFISSRQGEATPERGGRAKKYFKMEGTGLMALREADRIRKRLAAGIKPELIGGTI
jgi:PadR family transcriptional regulator, regulatory protein PadR